MTTTTKPMGLMTSILQKNPTRVRTLTAPVYRLNMAALKSPSDRELAATVQNVAGRIQRGEKVTSGEVKALRTALRRLEGRGLVTITTEVEE